MYAVSESVYYMCWIFFFFTACYLYLGNKNLLRFSSNSIWPPLQKIILDLTLNIGSVRGSEFMGWIRFLFFFPQFNMAAIIQAILYTLDIIKNFNFIKYKFNYFFETIQLVLSDSCYNSIWPPNGLIFMLKILKFKLFKI